MIDFTHGGYLNLLDFIKGLGRKICTLRDFPGGGPAVILRHDIDFSVTKALDMARLDTKAGVHSTFFVLLTAPFYNALAPKSVQQLREIAGMGHEVGLHYDCSLFEGLNESQMANRIEEQVRALAGALDTEITSISQHKPATSSIRPSFQSFRDAYNPIYCKDIAYVSDSRMRFGAPDAAEFFRKNERCQAVIHPLWWNEKKLSLQQVFDGIEKEILADAKFELNDFRIKIEAHYQKNNWALA